MPDFWGAKWWDAWQAFGTVGATAIALLLALLGGVRAKMAEAALAREREERAKADRLATASLVSAWVESGYEASDDGTHYLRRGSVNVANESNEPVFDVHVVVGIGRPAVQIGPLAVPTPIPVLPPRRHRNWDISLGLLGHGGGLDLPSDPVAKIYFTDSRGVRWERNFEGKLVEPAEGNHEPAAEEEALKQLGDPTNSFNPIWMAVEFLNLLRREDPPVTAAEISPMLAEKAAGWSDMNDEALRNLGQELEDYGMATHVWYAAPQVAYVRLVEGGMPTGPQTAGYQEVQVRIITLVFYAGRGWRIFSVGGGATQPDWIEFPEGAIDDNYRGR
ncbi:hypothetical protein [Arthrobacter globiformis]|uniref:hypothetical protein n=1 Tax=Arthrobacter globiformis TaxID=1665 RepID=UPI001124D1A7|nr:hypothetical protein [Arthrobacter globiformis]